MIKVAYVGYGGKRKGKVHYAFRGGNDWAKSICGVANFYLPLETQLVNVNCKRCLKIVEKLKNK